MSPQLGRVSVKSALVPPRGTFYDTFALGFRIENRFFDPRFLPRGVSRAYTGSKFSHCRGKLARSKVANRRTMERNRAINSGDDERA